MLFGKNKERGIRLGCNNGASPETVDLPGGGTSEGDILVHDETEPSGAVAYLLSRFTRPEFPVPIGVFRAVKRPTYDELAETQIATASAKKGRGDIMDLLHSGETWKVE